jgi:Tol biopolymer transport system component
MSLTPGTRLGAYEITGQLGAGGMGEVYRARDTRLDRDVAIKVLPPDLAADPQFRARFNREARTISQLQHPHICTLHDIGDADGTAFLVMELLQGETLAERLKKGTLPLDEALQIAIDVADGLSAAHKQGIVHRDLKPANIMLTRTGAKLLDFGLAKHRDEHASLSATVSAAATDAASLTAVGTILGTLPYMAPEQIEGLDVDARTDIFALGAVLYEMITGRRAFQGKSQPSLIAAILSTDPPAPSHVLAGISPNLDHVVTRCLAKDPANRWQSVRDLGLELEWAKAPVTSSETAAAAARRAGRLTIVSLALVIVAVGALIASVMYVRSFRSATTAPDIRFEIPATGSPFNLTISPDGRSVAYVAPSETGVAMLWVRPLNALEARMLPGTNGAQTPDWSADGQSLVFVVPGERKVKKVDVAGGPAQTLADLQGGFSRSTSNREGIILFGNTLGGIRRVSASGGDASAITELDRSRGEVGHNTPWFLPDGRHFLYTAWSTQPENRAIYVGSLDSTIRKRLMTAESKALYAPPGFLLFLRAQTLMARRFDADRLEFTGDAVRVAEDVAYNPQLGQSAFYASDEGTLIYRKGSVVERPGTRQWVWKDRAGNTRGTLDLPLTANVDLRLSPDGTRVAYFNGGSEAFILGSGSGDVWIYDLDRNLPTRLTTDAAPSGFPVWSPDGTRVVFSSRRGTAAATALYEKASNGAVPEQIVLQPESGTVVFARDWSQDGRFVVFEKFSTLRRGLPRRELWMLPMSGERKPSPYLATAFDEGQPVLSPDGRWLAYVSNETLTNQVVVQPFPDPSSGKWQISADGGVYPRWRHDGRELYYLDPQRRIVAVAVGAEGGFTVGKPTPLFETGLPFSSNGPPVPYDVSGDGQRFLIAVPQDPSPPTTNATPITVVLNWQSALLAREKQ